MVDFHVVQFSHLVVSDSLWPHGLQHARLPCPSPTLGACQTHGHQVGGAVQPSRPLTSPPPPAFNHSQHESLFKWVSSHQVATSIAVSASASILPMSIQVWFPLGWTRWISLNSKGLTKVFFNTTFKSINSLVLRVLYSPNLTSIHDYWKNHSFD